MARLPGGGDTLRPVGGAGATTHPDSLKFSSSRKKDVNKSWLSCMAEVILYCPSEALLHVQILSSFRTRAKNVLTNRGLLHWQRHDFTARPRRNCTPRLYQVVELGPKGVSKSWLSCPAGGETLRPVGGAAVHPDSLKSSDSLRNAAVLPGEGETLMPVGGAVAMAALSAPRDLHLTLLFGV